MTALALQSAVSPAMAVLILLRDEVPLVRFALGDVAMDAREAARVKARARVVGTSGPSAV